MSRKKIVLILLAIIFGGYVGWQLLIPNNSLVNLYKWRYEEMSKPEYLKALRDFCRNDLRDPIENLTYSELIAWEHEYITYTPQQFNREEMPIAILRPYVNDGIAFGRCGEFALCMNGLLLANGYKTRLIIDASKPVTRFKFADNMISQNSQNMYSYPDQKVGKIIQDSIVVKINDSKINEPTKHGIYITGSYLYFITPIENGLKVSVEFEYYKSADDHVWVEVWDNNRWIHIDPTEQRIDQPKMYAVDWNKEINDVVAITKDDSGKMVTIDVTKEYQ
jgi:hypothetical protein